MRPSARLRSLLRLASSTALDSPGSSDSVGLLLFLDQGDDAQRLCEPPRGRLKFGGDSVDMGTAGLES